MADVQDVLDAVAGLAFVAIYPSGAESASVTGDKVLIYPGWPSGVQLENDLSVAKAHLSVFPMDAERNATRYSSVEEQELVAPAPTLTVSSTPTSISVGGLVSAEENVAVVVSSPSGIFDVVYQTTGAETLAQVASQVASLLVAAGVTAAATSETINVTGATSIEAAVGGTGKLQRELRRQERWFEMILWSSSPAQRSRLGPVIDEALAGVQFLELIDGSAGRLIYRGSPFLDKFEKENVYRRDWRITVEYGTTKTEDAVQSVVPKMVVSQVVDLAC